MIECFVCSFKFENPQKLCEHLKVIHQLSGQNHYKCKICGQQLTHMWRFRRHLDTCYISLGSNIETSDQENEEQNDLLNFEGKIHQRALEFVCKLAGNMCIPRNFVFEVLSDFKKFYSTMLTEGFSQYILPDLCEEKRVNVEYLLKTFENPFKRVDSEYKLNRILHDADLISTPKDIKFVKIDGKWYDAAEIPDFSDEDSLETEDNAESEDVDDGGADDSEKAQDSAKIWKSRVKNATERENVLLMPLEFQFRKFFELPNVFKKTQEYAKEVSEKNLGHFINGETWKKKLESFHKDDIVIPFHLHTDDVQVNNALGAHRQNGLETCTYYSFPLVPPEFNSQLDNIFVAQLFTSKATKTLGNFCCFKNMIETLNQFGQDGITLKIDGKQQKVNMFLLLFMFPCSLGDHKLSLSHPIYVSLQK